MRIIAGQLGGRRLKGPRGRAIRPTSDRMKEALFDILGARVRDARFLDAFAGTGSIGLEALSRGAREVVFVESSAAACRLLFENLRSLSVERGCRVLPHDFFRAIRELSMEESSTWDVLFMDPPYGWHSYEEMMRAVFESSIVRNDSLVIIEHDRRTTPPLSGTGYQRTRMRRQGDKCLGFYQRDTI